MSDDSQALPPPWYTQLFIQNKEVASEVITEKDWRMIHGHPVNVGGGSGGGGGGGGGKTAKVSGHDLPLSRDA